MGWLLVTPYVCVNKIHSQVQQENNFSSILLSRYLVSKVTGNRCQPRDRNVNLLYIAISGNVSIARTVIIIPLLEFYHNLLITANSVTFFLVKLQYVLDNEASIYSSIVGYSLNCSTNTYFPPFRFIHKCVSDTEESDIINIKRSHVCVDIRNTAMSFMKKHYCTTI